MRLRSCWTAARNATGFGRLGDLNRLDLSVEFLVLQPKWQSLFTDAERRLARSRLEDGGYVQLPEESGVDDALYEGAVHLIRINAYERNPVARAKCIAHYGLSCVVCGFNFQSTYGPVGEKIIHVHHLKPLSEIGEKYKMDPIVDLRPVCPNCHVVIHWGGETRRIEDVRRMLKL